MVIGEASDDVKKANTIHIFKESKKELGKRQARFVPVLGRLWSISSLKEVPAMCRTGGCSGLASADLPGANHT